MKVEFLLKTDSGYPRDAGVFSFTMATPGSSLTFGNKPDGATTVEKQT